LTDQQKSANTQLRVSINDRRGDATTSWLRRLHATAAVSRLLGKLWATRLRVLHGLHKCSI
jgi:hypothetical protein